MLGERANMTKTLNYGALAREQMSGVAQMEKQMQDNLRRFDVKHGLGTYGYKVPTRTGVPNRAQQVYKLDPVSQVQGMYSEHGGHVA